MIKKKATKARIIMKVKALVVGIRYYEQCWVHNNFTGTIEINMFSIIIWFGE